MESVPLMVITMTRLEKSTLMKKGVSPTSTWKVAYTISMCLLRRTCLMAAMLQLQQLSPTITLFSVVTTLLSLLQHLWEKKTGYFVYICALQGVPKNAIMFERP